MLPYFQSGQHKEHSRSISWWKTWSQVETRHLEHSRSLENRESGTAKKDLIESIRPTYRFALLRFLITLEIWYNLKLLPKGFYPWHIIWPQYRVCSKHAFKNTIT